MPSKRKHEPDAATSGDAQRAEPSVVGVEAPEVTPVPQGAQAVSDPEPKQHPALGTKDPQWQAWKLRQEGGR